MMHELLSFFNMTTDPFSKDIKTENLITLHSLDQALQELKLFCEFKGIGLLVGKSGCGKSCLLRLLKSELSNFETIYLCHTSVSVTEFYGHLAVALGLSPTGRRATLFRAVKERLEHLNTSRKIHPLLILDEAHLLSQEILLELRLLNNFHIDSQSYLSILLCGQEELVPKLSLSILEPLVNSITTTVSLKTLEKDETFAYVESRLKASGALPTLFSQSALTSIHQVSGGIFRVINTIALNALKKAFIVKASSIDASIVQSITHQ